MLFKMFFTLLLLVFHSILVIANGAFPPKLEEPSVVGIPAGHLKQFGSHRSPDGPIEEIRGFLHPTVFWEKYVSVRKPLVLRQAAAKSPALKTWSDDYLAKEYGDLDVLLEVKRENRSKSPKRVNISKFIDIYTKEDVYAVTLLPDPMRKDIQVPSCLLCGTFRDFVHETNFWMSSGGTRSVIHYDADENIHCIISGSKDFIMIDDPYQKFLPMVEKSPLSGSGYSVLDPDSVDLLKYPDVAKVQWVYTTLNSGDCLYIPSKYLHQVRSHRRTISATILFTSNINKTFEKTGCEGNKFEYTPLSDIDVHWRYNKGDTYIDMGYINLELLRDNMLVMFEDTGLDFLTTKQFALYLKYANEDMDDPVTGIDALYFAVFGKKSDEKVFREDIYNLPREQLKVLARHIDDPHGPLKENKEIPDNLTNSNADKEEL